jgi:hypothetical protein
MGDRANVWIREDDKDTGVWLYTHWAGSELPGYLQEALVLADEDNRLDDIPYLGRIIFCRMIQGPNTDIYEAGKGLTQTTGYGISSRLGDGGHRVLEIIDGKVIWVDFDFNPDKPIRTWTFQEYIDDEGVPELWEDQ